MGNSQLASGGGCAATARWFAAANRHTAAVRDVTRVYKLLRVSLHVCVCVAMSRSFHPRYTPMQERITVTIIHI